MFKLGNGEKTSCNVLGSVNISPVTPSRNTFNCTNRPLTNKKNVM